MSKPYEKLTFYSVSGKKHKCNQRKELGPLNKREMLDLLNNILHSGQTEVLTVSRSEPPKKADKSSHPSKYRSKHSR